MSGTSPAFDYWRNVSHLSIWEAASLMAGYDPRAIPDVTDRQGDGLTLDDEQDQIQSAIDVGEINVLQGHHLHITDVRILKQDFLMWLRKIGMDELAAKLSLPPAEETELNSISGAGLNDRISSVTDQALPIPGRLPRTAAAKLAVEIAWELECEHKRKATAREVINEMGQRATAGTHPDILKSYDQSKRQVIWVTATCNDKDFGGDACGAALKRWHDSRSSTLSDS